MPAFASHVQRMTARSASERGAGLDGMMSILDDLSEEQLLAVVREPGLLAALNLFLSGDRSLTALKVLDSLMGKAINPISLALMLSYAAIFDSPCFPSLKDIASSGRTLELKQSAWAAITGLACMEEGRLREMFDSPGMVALLQAGLESADITIASMASATVYNLCEDETIASAIFDSPCFPSAKNVAALGSTLGLKREAWKFITCVTNMEEGRLRELFDSPGMVALMQTGLASMDVDIAESAAITISNLCYDETTATAVLDGHPDLVQAIADTFCNVGVCEQFMSKSQLRSLFSNLNSSDTFFSSSRPSWVQNAHEDGAHD